MGAVGKYKLMINVKPTNIQLQKSVISIACEILECNEDEAIRMLEANNWSIRETVEAVF